MNTLRQFKRNLTGVYKRELLSLPLYLLYKKIYGTCMFTYTIFQSKQEPDSKVTLYLLYHVLEASLAPRFRAKYP